MQISIKVSCKLVSTFWASLLIGMIKQINKFAISLQYLRKEVRDLVHFLLADKYQSFYKLALSFLMKVARHAESTPNSNLVMFLQYLKKNVFYFCVLL